MGGYGSGRYTRLGVKNSRRVTQFQTLDIRQLRKERQLRPGEQARIEFEYSIRGGPPFVAVSAAVVWVPYHFGLRPFFECPGCGRHCCRLYLAERAACRECLGLSYPVQFETKLNQGFRRAWKARNRLTDKGGLGDWIWPWHKPKGMHRTTFDRLLEKANSTNAALWAGLAGKVGL